jgi:hypothetical protein
VTVTKRRSLLLSQSHSFADDTRAALLKSTMKVRDASAARGMQQLLRRLPRASGEKRRPERRGEKAGMKVRPNRQTREGII